MKACTVEGCDKPHRSRGLCSTHYNQQDQGRHKKVKQVCAACGSVVVKVKSGPRRTVCSYRCRYYVTNGRWPESGREIVGPVRPTKYVDAPVTTITPTRSGFIAGQCGWCATWFVHDLRTTGVASRHCTSSCAKRAAKARREARLGRFDVSPAVRLAIYERDAWTCQLCNEGVDKTLPPHHRWAATLDHIECQAWTLVPDHSPKNLRLAHRLCNSIRGDERYISSAA